MSLICISREAIPNKYCLWEKDLVFYMQLFSLTCQGVNLLCLRLTQKALQVLFYLFFSFYPSRSVLMTDCQNFFRRRFKISYQVGMWSRSGLFLGNTKKYFHKNCSSSCYPWNMWHTTATCIHSIQKSPRNNQKLGKKLVSRWTMIQESEQREIVLIRKKVWIKRREKMFKRRDWLMLHVK